MAQHEHGLITDETPLIKALNEVLIPFREFIHHETSSGLLLMAKTGILLASIIGSYLWLYLAAKNHSGQQHE